MLVQPSTIQTSTHSTNASALILTGIVYRSLYKRTFVYANVETYVASVLLNLNKPYCAINQGINVRIIMRKYISFNKKCISGSDVSPSAPLLVAAHHNSVSAATSRTHSSCSRFTPPPSLPDGLLHSPPILVSEQQTQKQQQIVKTNNEQPVLGYTVLDSQPVDEQASKAALLRSSSDGIRFVEDREPNFEHGDWPSNNNCAVGQQDDDDDEFCIIGGATSTAANEQSPVNTAPVMSSIHS